MPSSKHTEFLIEQSNARAEEVSNAPPAYEEATSSTAPRDSSQAQPTASPKRKPYFRDITFISTPPTLQYSLYAPPGCSVSADKSVVTLRCPAEPRALRKAVEEQLSLPPRMQLRISGEHKGVHGKEIDFDMKFDMLRYFVAPSADLELSASNPYMQLVSFKTPQMTEKGSTAGRPTRRVEVATILDSFFPVDGPKSLCIDRQVCNWNLEWIKERIHALASSINYKGTLTIEIQSTMASTVRFVADGSSKKRATAPWLTSFVGLFEKSKKWEVKAMWPYANIEADENISRGAAAQAGRQCVVCDEDEWWLTWKQVVRGGMLGKRTGWMGVEDWIDAAMKPADEDVKGDVWSWFGGASSVFLAEPIKPWGVDFYRH